VRRGQSSVASLPVRSRCDSTFPSAHISLCVTSAFDISSVNSATGTPWRTETLAAMQSASADFPIEGRAATITRFPGWNPEVRRSRSRKPDGVPVMSLPASYSFVIVLNVRELGRDALLGEIEDDLLRPVDELDRLAGPVEAEAGDVGSRPDEPAQ